MRLTCVRHGRTAWNVAGRFTGWADVPLDEVGRAQAHAIAERLAPERFDIVLSSDLRRASETAAAIARSTRIVVQNDRRLREIDFGSWEGLTWSEIVARDQRKQAPHVEDARPDRVIDLWSPPGGETFDALRDRVRPVIASLERLPHAGHALLVSHAGVMHAILCITLARPERVRNVVLAPGAIMRLTYDDVFWSLRDVQQGYEPIDRHDAGGARCTA